MPNEIVLTTADKELFRDLTTDAPEGAKVSIFYTRAIEFEEVARLVISFTSDIAIGIFSAWLYDRMKERGSKKTTIDGRDIPSDVQQITIIINNTLQQHQQQSQENHESDS